MTTEAKVIIGTILATLIVIAAGMLFFGKSQTAQDVKGAADQNVLYSNNIHTIGDKNAPIKIVEFADFQCPACAAAYPITKKIIEQNSQKVYFVARHYPLPSHDNAQIAAKAVEAAANQGKFWEMYELLFLRQKDWSGKNNAEEIFTDYAKELSLDIETFENDLDPAVGTINTDYADGNKLGVNSTPTFFINGQKYTGVITEDQFQQILNSISQQ